MYSQGIPVLDYPGLERLEGPALAKRKEHAGPSPKLWHMSAPKTMMRTECGTCSRRSEIFFT